MMHNSICDQQKINKKKNYITRYGNYAKKIFLILKRRKRERERGHGYKLLRSQMQLMTRQQKLQDLYSQEIN